MSGKGATLRVARFRNFAWIACAAMVAAPGSVRADATSGALAYAGSLTPVAEVAQRIPLVEQTMLRHVQLTVNKSKVIKVGVPVGNVLVGASEIADVLPVSDESLYLLGKKIGTTNVTLFDSDKKLVGIVDINVTPDVSTVQSQVTQGTGDDGLHVHASGGKVVLTGTAHDAVSVDRAMQVAPPGTVNLAQVASPQQVMLRVRFVEIDRTAGRDLGVSFGYNSQPVSGGGTGVYGNPPTRNGVSILSAISATVPFATIFQKFGSSTQNFDVLLSALETKGLARVLAEPNLVASSGETAQFLAGGEIPIPVSSTTGTGVPTITVTYKKYGVQLKFTPTVLKNGEIHLHLVPEVSQIDPTTTINTGVISIPALTERSAETGVTLRDGQSFAIAGLLEDISQRNLNQLPWLGNLPVLGTLFRDAGYLQHETELVVIVTPRLVKPARPGDVLTDPLESTVAANDADLFLDGKVEIRKKRLNALATAQGIARFGHLLPLAAPAINGSKP